MNVAVQAFHNLLICLHFEMHYKNGELEARHGVKKIERMHSNYMHTSYECYHLKQLHGGISTPGIYCIWTRPERGVIVVHTQEGCSPRSMIIARPRLDIY